MNLPPDGDGGGGAMSLLREGEEIRRPVSSEREVKGEPGADGSRGMDVDA